MLLIVPVWTVRQNFFGTMIGRWHTFGGNLPAKFLIMGAHMYLAGCFQGSTEALRSIQQPTHFTDFVISHSHLTVFGTFVVWALGGLVYTWPKLCRRELWSRSEEHTSELQSLMRISYAVFCLKKKNITITTHQYALVNI